MSKRKKKRGRVPGTPFFSKSKGSFCCSSCGRPFLLFERGLSYPLESDNVVSCPVCRESIRVIRKIFSSIPGLVLTEGDIYG